MKRIVLMMVMAIGFVFSVSALTTVPSFPGGDAALSEYVSANIVYPTTAIENSIEGTVTVEFTVKADGSITGAKIVRPVDPDLEDEALRIVKGMPRWTPATDGAKSVDAVVTLPVKFRLPKENN